MSNSNFVVTPSTTNTSGIKSLNTIIGSAPFVDGAGNIDMNGQTLIGSSTQVALTSDNTNTTCFIPFSKTAFSTANNLFIDNITGPLTYNPSTGVMVSPVFSPGNGNSTFSLLDITGLEVLSATSGRTRILNNQITVATTQSGFPPTTTINPNSITCSSLNLGSTTTITPTSVTAGSGSSAFSLIQTTDIQVVNGGTNTTITPNTVTSTTFVTGVAPANANQLGNKLYIDNFGGSGGWYFTTTVSVTASTIVNFPNCLNNTYNAYEIYFVPNLTSPTGSFYPNLDMTFSGVNVPTYQSFTQTQTTGGSFSNSYVTTAPRLLFGFHFEPILNRQTTIKLDLWGTNNISTGTGNSRLTYSSEGLNANNPGQTAWIKSFGTVSYSTGTATGIIFTYSVAVTGSIKIIVKSKY